LISDEKVAHVLNLMLNGIEKAGMVKFSDKQLAFNEARKAFFTYIAQVNSVEELARHRILSQKNPPPEHSPQWETLYRKYFEEELRKKGG